MLSSFSRTSAQMSRRCRALVRGPWTLRSTEPTLEARLPPATRGHSARGACLPGCSLRSGEASVKQGPVTSTRRGTPGLDRGQRHRGSWRRAREPGRVPALRGWRRSCRRRRPSREHHLGLDRQREQPAGLVGDPGCQAWFRFPWGGMAAGPALTAEPEGRPRLAGVTGSRSGRSGPAAGKPPTGGRDGAGPRRRPRGQRGP